MNPTYILRTSHNASHRTASHRITSKPTCLLADKRLINARAHTCLTSHRRSCLWCSGAFSGEFIPLDATDEEKKNLPEGYGMCNETRMMEICDAS